MKVRFVWTVILIQSLLLAANKNCCYGDDAKSSFFSLAGQSGLPKYLKANSGALADSVGIRGGEVRTLTTDFLSKDFVLDVVFQFKHDQDGGIGVVGIGENARDGGWVANSILINLVGPQKGGFAEIITDHNANHKQIGKFPNPGPHVARLSKTGPALSLEIFANYDAAAGLAEEPDFSHTIPDLKTEAKYLTRLNCALFFGGDAIFSAVRLSVNGKPLDPGAPANQGFAEVTGGAGLVKLRGAKKLPPFLLPQPGIGLGRDGLDLSGKTIRTKQADLLGKNFTFDVVYRFKPGEKAIMLIGMGANRRDGGNWILDSVCSRVHGPGHNGEATVTFHNFFDDPRFATLGPDKNGPNLFRLQKRGDTLTMAICEDFKGEFKPDYMVTIPSLRTAAPTIPEKQACLFVGEAGVIEQIRLLIDGETVETQELELAVPAQIEAGKLVKTKILKNAGGRTFSVVDGPEGLALSSQGELTWKPTADQAGKHEIEITIKDKGKTTNQTVTIEVLPPDPTIANKNAAKTLEGKWQAIVVIDDAKLKPLLEAQKVPADQMPEALKNLSKMFAGINMTFEFRADGKGDQSVAGMTPQPDVTPGKWSVTEVKGKVMIVEFVNPSGDRLPMKLTFPNRNEFSGEISDDLAGPLKQPIRFRRVEPGK